MSNANHGGGMSSFMKQAQQSITECGGVNSSSISLMAGAAAQAGISYEEMEAAGAQLGLSGSHVKRVAREAGLASEGGSGGSGAGKVLVLAALGVVVLLAGLAAGAGSYVAVSGSGFQFDFTQSGGSQPVQVAENQQVPNPPNPADKGEEKPSKGGGILPPDNGKTDSGSGGIFPKDGGIFPKGDGKDDSGSVKLPGGIKLPGGGGFPPIDVGKKDDAKPDKKPDPKKPDTKPDAGKPKTEPEPSDPRVAQLKKTSEALLARARPDAKNPIDTLKETMNLTFASTLAVALAQKNSGKFDNLAKNPPQLDEYVEKIKPKQPEPPKKEDPPKKEPPMNGGGKPGGNQGGFAGGNPGAGFAGGNPGAGFAGGNPGAGIAGGNPGAGFAGGNPGAGFAGGNPGAGFAGGNPGAGFAGGNPGAGFAGGNPGAGFAGGNPGAGIAGGNPGAGIAGGNPGAGFGGARGGAFRGGNPGAGFGGGGRGGAFRGGNPGGGGFAGFAGGNKGGGFVGGGNNGGFVGGNGFQGGNKGGSQPPKNKGPEFSNEEKTLIAIRELEAGTAQTHVRAIEFLSKESKATELTTHQAEAVAGYLLTVNNAEFKFVKPNLSGLKRYRALWIALADMTSKAASSPRMQDVLNGIMDENVKLVGDKQWRSKARIMLFQKALAMNGPQLEGEGIQLILRDLYKGQATLLGVEVPENAKQPSVILEKLIRGMMAQLKNAGLSASEKAQVDSVNDQIAAIDFLAGNDLQKTVGFQRVWLKLLALQVAKLNSDRAADAQAIVDELFVDQSRESNVVQQMWTAERHLLRMWMLRIGQPVMIARK